VLLYSIIFIHFFVLELVLLACQHAQSRAEEARVSRITAFR
jgi:hypothetical protein